MQAVQLMSLVGSLAVAGGTPDAGMREEFDQDATIRARSFSHDLVEQPANSANPPTRPAVAWRMEAPALQKVGLTSESDPAKAKVDGLLDAAALLPEADMDTPQARTFAAALEFLQTQPEVFDALSATEQEAFTQKALAALEALYPASPAPQPAPRTIETFLGTILADHDSPESIPRIMDFGQGDERICIEYAAGAATPKVRIEDLDNGDQLIWADKTALVWLVRPRSHVTAEQVHFIPVETLTA